MTASAAIDRASFGWLGLLLGSLVALPWYAVGGLGETAPVIGFADRPWLLPVVGLSAALAVLAATARDWRRHPALLPLVTAGLAALLLQAFGIGLNGPKGRIAQVGTPEDLYERPASAFIANFIGDANLIEGRVMAGRFQAEGLYVPLPGADGAASVSIRPERIALDVSADGPARVASATYLGSRMEYTVALGSAEVLVSRPISEPRLEAGQRVTLRIDTDGATRLSSTDIP